MVLIPHFYEMHLLSIIGWCNTFCSTMSVSLHIAWHVLLVKLSIFLLVTVHPSKVKRIRLKVVQLLCMDPSHNFCSFSFYHPPSIYLWLFYNWCQPVCSLNIESWFSTMHQPACSFLNCCDKPSIGSFVRLLMVEEKLFWRVSILDWLETLRVSYRE